MISIDLIDMSQGRSVAMMKAITQWAVRVWAANLGQ